MGIDFIYPEYEVRRDPIRCINCNACVKQCSHGVHQIDEKSGGLMADDAKCVNCQRCVSFCPTRAIKIVKSDCAPLGNMNWRQRTVHEIYKQAGTGGVLLSSMGSPKEMPVYWDRLLLNASQVTNPPIDPLREPMETRVLTPTRPWPGPRRSLAYCTTPARAGSTRISISTGPIPSCRWPPGGSGSTSGI